MFPLTERLEQETSQLKEMVSHLEREKAHLFQTHDEKVNEITQRNLRIQEELQQTVIRVSE